MSVFITWIFWIPIQDSYSLLTPKGKAVPVTSLDRPWGFQEVEAPRFHDSQNMKVVRLSAQLPWKRISFGGWVNPRPIVRLEELWQWKLPLTPLGNKTHNLLARNAVPQPTALQRVPLLAHAFNINCIFPQLYLYIFLYCSLQRVISLNSINHFIIELPCVHS